MKVYYGACYSTEESDISFRPCNGDDRFVLRRSGGSDTRPCNILQQLIDDHGEEVAIDIFSKFNKSLIKLSEGTVNGQPRGVLVLYKKNDNRETRNKERVYNKKQ